MTSQSTHAPGATRIELAVAAIVLAEIAFVQLLVSGTFRLLWRPLWLDEYLTSLLSNDPGFFHAMSAIREGVETNPPTMYLLLWPASQVCGGLGPLGLRIFALGSMLLAMVGVYGICRQFFSRMPAALGTLALWAHPMILAHAFEARFYGPWLAATIWFTYALLTDRHLAIQCVLAVLAATMHWFGLIGVVLICTTDLTIHRGGGWRRIVPMACGLGATLLATPFFLGQRSGLSAVTWVAPATAKGVLDVVVRLYGAPAIMMVLVVYWFWRVLVSPKLLEDAQRGTPQDLRGLAPFCSLILFLPLLIIFSVLVQPAMIDRYFILALAPLAPLAAWLATPMDRGIGRGFAWATLVLLFALGTTELTQVARETDATSAAMAAAAADVRVLIDRGEPTPIVFKRRHEQYPLLRLHPDLADVTAVLDFDLLPGRARLSERSLFERDMARRVNEFYPRHRLVLPERLRAMRKAVLIMPPGEQDEVQQLLPEARIKHIAPSVLELTFP